MILIMSILTVNNDNNNIYYYYYYYRIIAPCPPIIIWDIHSREWRGDESGM